jgi:SCP-2 sterol transfer family
MYLSTFISKLNKARFLTPLLNRTLIVEICPTQESSHYIEITSQGAKSIQSPLEKVDFILGGTADDLKEVLLNDSNLKQLIAFGKITFKGSYRDFLKLEALIKLS